MLRPCCPRGPACDKTKLPTTPPPNPRTALTTITTRVFMTYPLVPRWRQRPGRSSRGGQRRFHLHRRDHVIRGHPQCPGYEVLRVPLALGEVDAVRERVKPPEVIVLDPVLAQPVR